MRSKGLSAVELMACLAVCGVLVALAAPGMAEMGKRNLASGASNQLLAMVNHARSEAVFRRRSTGVCPSMDGTNCAGTREWSSGLLSWVDDNGNGLREGDEQVMRVMAGRDFRGQRLVGTSGRSQLGFRADGRSAGHNATLALCGRDGTLARRIILNNGGRARIEPGKPLESCPAGP